LSWRVLLLPHLGEEDLYRHFRLDEPWDSPHNIELLPRMPNAFRRPSLDPLRRWMDEPGTTPFQVFVGPGTAFEVEAEPQITVDFPDGLSNTILIDEARDAVPWTKPADLAYRPDRPFLRWGGPTTRHGRGSTGARPSLGGSWSPPLMARPGTSGSTS
jgi:hypothetical protein